MTCAPGTPSPDQQELVHQLIAGFHRSLAEERVRGVTIPLSAVIDAARSSLEACGTFPPHANPEELGDGALIERRGKHLFRVYERFETGQMRFSAISFRSCLFLRSAVLRYLKHYRTLLRLDRVRIT